MLFMKSCGSECSVPGSPKSSRVLHRVATVKPVKRLNLRLIDVLLVEHLRQILRGIQ